MDNFETDSVQAQCHTAEHTVLHHMTRRLLQDLGEMKMVCVCVCMWGGGGGGDITQIHSILVEMNVCNKLRCPGGRQLKKVMNQMHILVVSVSDLKMLYLSCGHVQLELT